MVHSLDAASAALDAPLRRVRLDPPLPCGSTGCDQQATSALFEPDPEHPGLWLAFPLCEACTQRLSQDIADGSTGVPRQDHRTHERTEHGASLHQRKP